jgi:tetratricopeptide (TPR) repeat protein
MATRSLRPDLEALHLMRSGRLTEALDCARRAAEGSRVCVPAHGMLATLLIQLGRKADAETAVTAALACEPGSADAYDALAYASLQLSEHERANWLYRRAVELAPESSRCWYNLASSERSFGRLEEAESACDRAIAADREHYQSYLLRSELQVQTESINHVKELKALVGQRRANHRARIFLGYALAKELDDLHRYDEAFLWYSNAAMARREKLAYDVGVDETKLARIADVFPAEATTSYKDPAASANYIFVMGLPRSGTTLIERILTGLPGVHSNGETENFSSALLAESPKGSTDVFARAAVADKARVAIRYATLAGGTPGDTVVEKLPMNYLYIGAIRRALPEAKLVLVTRTPIDSCFAMYRTLFGNAYPFTYDFEDLARYYEAYHRLISHWRNSIHNPMIEISYEDLVQAPTRAGAAMARACGLPWIDSATSIDKNTAVSLTASAAQIRRPIYGTSSGRWRHYRTHLAPLIHRLRDRSIPIPPDA